MPVFRRNLGHKISLISVHIPKTAGTSFRNTLRQVYGEHAVLRVDISPAEEYDPEDPFASPPSELDSGVRVLHGHFNPKDLHTLYPSIPKDTPMITWLRNPVDRVISNYQYLRKRIRDELAPTGVNVGVANRMLKSLMEYAEQPVARNRIERFLRGFDLKEFLFIGLQEQYSEDLQELADIMAWEQAAEFYHNPSEGDPVSIDEDVRAHILKLNKLDWQIYQEALEIRSNHVSHRRKNSQE